MESTEPAWASQADRPASNDSGTSPREPSPNRPRNTREGSHESEGSSSMRVAHTLTACIKCRKRKTRCDVGLPRCRTCERANEPCNYWDASREKEMSRAWVVRLQEKVQAMETELAKLNQEESAMPDAAHIVREAGLVRSAEFQDPRFLGPSSGIAMSRLVLELVKQSSGSKQIRNVLPLENSRTNRAQIAQDEANRQAYPIHSAVEPMTFPSFLLTEKLVDVYCHTAQYMLPTLHEPTFRQDLLEVYHGSTDPYKNFVLKIVIAISMQKLHIRWAGVADSWYMAAMRHFEPVVRSMDLGTLQCFVLVAQYALLTPTRTALYYISGLATRLCLRLGLHRDEPSADNAGALSRDPLERDMRCRLFWVVNSMEFGISHTLGRPSAFSIPPDCMHRRFFKTVDDKYITKERIFAGPQSLKKLIAIHFFKMRLLQSEIKIKLYQQEGEAPFDDSDPWFAKMESRLEQWRLEGPQNDEGSGLTDTWFKGKYYGMMIFLFRPSPHIPHPSVSAARKCYEACTFNVTMSGTQVEKSLVDITWVFVQTLFMSLNTLLWVMSYPEIRTQHSKEEIAKYLNIALTCLDGCSERWPEVESALELYRNLVNASLRVYDGDDDSVNDTEPSSLPSPDNLYTATPLNSPPRGSGVPHYGSGQPSTSTNAGPYGYNQPTGLQQQQTYQLPPGNLAPGGNQPIASGSTFDPNSMFNAFPSNFTSETPWDLTYNATSPAVTVLSDGTTLNMNDSFFTPMNADYFEQAGLAKQPPLYPQAQAGLNHEQHLELTNSMEVDGIADLGTILQQSADFFGTGNVL